MDPTVSAKHPAALRFEAPNWVASETLPRDQEQSHRLHEPEHMITTIDPITGQDIANVTSHPHIVDGNLTIYFESEETRKAYLNTPIDHPFEILPGSPAEDDDRGG